MGVEGDRIVAAAHLKSYRADADVGADYCDAASVDWVVWWPDHRDAGRLLLNTTMQQFRRWAAPVWYADGALPCLGVYRIPDAWPPIRRPVQEAGFDDRQGRAEIIFEETWPKWRHQAHHPVAISR